MLLSITSVENVRAVAATPRRVRAVVVAAAAAARRNRAAAIAVTRKRSGARRTLAGHGDPPTHSTHAAHRIVQARRRRATDCALFFFFPPLALSARRPAAMVRTTAGRKGRGGRRRAQSPRADSRMSARGWGRARHNDDARRATKRRPSTTAACAGVRAHARACSPSVSPFGRLGRAFFLGCGRARGQVHALALPAGAGDRARPQNQERPPAVPRVRMPQPSRCRALASTGHSRNLQKGVANPKP